MDKSNLNQYINLQPVECSFCRKLFPSYFYLLTQQQQPACLECIKSNDEILRNIKIPYKDYLQEIFTTLPLPEYQFASKFSQNLENMKNDALRIIAQVKQNISQFQFDILEFYTQGRIMCENYIEKIKSLIGKSRQQIIKNSLNFKDYQQTVYKIKSKNKICSKIQELLQQLKIKIPSIKNLTNDYQKFTKRHSIAEVPVQSAISVRGVLYFGTADGKIIFQDEDQWKEIKAHQSLIRSLAYDGMYTLYSGSDDFKIKAWDLHNKKQPKCIAQFGSVAGQGKSYHRDIVIFNRGRTMASTRGTFDGFKIRLWQLKTYKNIKKFQGHTNYIRGMSMLKDDQIITVSDDKTIRVWDVNKSKCSKVFYHTKKIHNLHCNKEKKLVCVWDQENRVIILDGNNLKLLQCWAVGRKILCSEGKERIYFGLSSQIVVYDWFGVKLGHFPLEVKFVPGLLLQVTEGLIVCDGKGKCIQIPLNSEQFIHQN